MRDKLQSAIDWGNHTSVHDPKVMAQFNREAREKEAAGQATIILWDDIKNNFPPEMNSSPLTAATHKLRKWRAILDLSFRL